MKTPVTLLALLIVPLAGLEASENDHLPGQTGSLAALLAVESVRQDLGITASQASRLDALRTRYRDAARAVTASAGSSDAERRAAWQDIQTLTSKSNTQALALLTPAQRKKLAAHEYRYLGASLLYLPSVQERLGLSPGQVRQIKDLQAGADARISEINARFEAGKIGPHQRRALLRKDRLGRNARLEAVLTRSQRAGLESLGRADM
jgi:Spy/CpxP family protein refolding chaperone